METDYFTKMFYLKKDESWIQRMDKKIKKETKWQTKRLKKQSEKNQIDKKWRKIAQFMFFFLLKRPYPISARLQGSAYSKNLILFESVVWLLESY